MTDTTATFFVSSTKVALRRMTLAELLKLYSEAEAFRKLYKAKGLRMGQAFMTTLPIELAAALVNTQQDCYYDDDKIADTFNAIMRGYADR